MSIIDEIMAVNKANSQNNLTDENTNLTKTEEKKNDAQTKEINEQSNTLQEQMPYAKYKSLSPQLQAALALKDGMFSNKGGSTSAGGGTSAGGNDSYSANNSTTETGNGGDQQSSGDTSMEKSAQGMFSSGVNSNSTGGDGNNESTSSGIDVNNQSTNLTGSDAISKSLNLSNDKFIKPDNSINKNYSGNVQTVNGGNSSQESNQNENNTGSSQESNQNSQNQSGSTPIATLSVNPINDKNLVDQANAHNGLYGGDYSSPTQPISNNSLGINPEYIGTHTNPQLNFHDLTEMLHLEVPGFSDLSTDSKNQAIQNYGKSFNNATSKWSATQGQYTAPMVQNLMKYGNHIQGMSDLEVAREGLKDLSPIHDDHAINHNHSSIFKDLLEGTTLPIKMAEGLLAHHVNSLSSSHQYALLHSAMHSMNNFWRTSAGDVLLHGFNSKIAQGGINSAENSVDNFVDNHRGVIGTGLAAIGTASLAIPGVGEIAAPLLYSADAALEAGAVADVATSSGLAARIGGLGSKVFQKQDIGTIMKYIGSNIGRIDLGASIISTAGDEYQGKDINPLTDTAENFGEFATGGQLIDKVVMPIGHITKNFFKNIPSYWYAASRSSQKMINRVTSAHVAQQSFDTDRSISQTGENLLSEGNLKESIDLAKDQQHKNYEGKILDISNSDTNPFVDYTQNKNTASDALVSHLNALNDQRIEKYTPININNTNVADILSREGVGKSDIENMASSNTPKSKLKDMGRYINNITPNKVKDTEELARNHSEIKGSFDNALKTYKQSIIGDPDDLTKEILENPDGELNPMDNPSKVSQMVLNTNKDDAEHIASIKNINSAIGEQPHNLSEFLIKHGEYNGLTSNAKKLLKSHDTSQTYIRPNDVEDYLKQMRKKRNSPTISPEKKSDYTKRIRTIENAHNISLSSINHNGETLLTHKQNADEFFNKSFSPYRKLFTRGENSNNYEAESFYDPTKTMRSMGEEAFNELPSDVKDKLGNAYVNDNIYAVSNPRSAIQELRNERPYIKKWIDDNGNIEESSLEKGVMHQEFGTLGTPIAQGRSLIDGMGDNPLHTIYHNLNKKGMIDKPFNRSMLDFDDLDGKQIPEKVAAIMNNKDLFDSLDDQVKSHFANYGYMLKNGKDSKFKMPSYADKHVEEHLLKNPFIKHKTIEDFLNDKDAMESLGTQLGINDPLRREMAVSKIYGTLFNTRPKRSVGNIIERGIDNIKHSLYYHGVWKLTAGGAGILSGAGVAGLLPSVALPMGALLGIYAHIPLLKQELGKGAGEMIESLMKDPVYEGKLHQLTTLAGISAAQQVNGTGPSNYTMSNDDANELAKSLRNLK